MHEGARLTTGWILVPAFHLASFTLSVSHTHTLTRVHTKHHSVAFFTTAARGWGYTTLLIFFFAINDRPSKLGQATTSNARRYIQRLCAVDPNTTIFLQVSLQRRYIVSLVYFAFAPTVGGGQGTSRSHPTCTAGCSERPVLYADPLKGVRLCVECSLVFVQLNKSVNNDHGSLVFVLERETKCLRVESMHLDNPSVDYDCGRFFFPLCPISPFSRWQMLRGRLSPLRARHTHTLSSETSSRF